MPRVESDEYVEITNLGDQPQDLADWVLMDILEGYPSFIFPSYILTPGKNTRVYTNEYHSEWGGFSFEYSRAIWNNREPDVAVLYYSQSKEVSRESYYLSKAFPENRQNKSGLSTSPPLSPSPSKERGIKGVRLINNLNNSRMHL